jgi:hypothetical protein
MAIGVKSSLFVYLFYVSLLLVLFLRHSKSILKKEKKNLFFLSKKMLKKCWQMDRKKETASEIFFLEKKLGDGEQKCPPATSCWSDGDKHSWMTWQKMRRRFDRNVKILIWTSHGTIEILALEETCWKRGKFFSAGLQPILCCKERFCWAL